MLEVTSHQNPRIKEIIKLKDRRGRDKTNKTFLEGYRLISRALDAGFPMEECYFCPSLFLGTNESSLLSDLEKRGTKLIKVTESILIKMAYKERPEGLIAVSPKKKHSLSDLPQVKNGLYLVLEAIEKPGNLGSIMRSADASGVNGILICDKCTDVYNPNVLTASTGAIFYVPFAECSSEEALYWLKKNDITTLAATPHANKSYDTIDMTISIAIVVGAEQVGLSKFWLKNSQIKTIIPMNGRIDSLNVAIAASIILFEASRQRRLAFVK
jgi:TrmH family RNA methyltransferase